MAQVVTNVVFTDASTTVADIQKKVASSVGSPHMTGNKLCNYIMQLLSKSRDGKFTVQVQNNDGVAASATATLASVVAADTITICGVTLTAHASTQDGTHFVVGGTDTITAANLVTCIKANTTLSTFLTASSALAVVTITALAAGTSGNGYTLSESAHFTLSGAVFTGGAADTGTTNSYSLGI